ncbi:hypothetical protein LMG27198_27580 [Methylocystis echinoides]|jgi:hypothetical protein|uniref:Uncharacterized protein n=1 Tax=Methylocystis echinoides TaxID=29468 RepID=A0A9W6GVM2_9HYPH|nr:hypothetical protein LMG27198_27580 [Methylocystis echinoides]
MVFGAVWASEAFGDVADPIAIVAVKARNVAPFGSTENAYLKADLIVGTSTINACHKRRW